MGSFQEEAAITVSEAITTTDGDMLSALSAAHDKWSAELAATKDNARSLLASVLADRESLRSSLAMAAALWKTLRPRDMSEPRAGAKDRKETVPEEYMFLASDEQIEAASALQNVSHTLFLTEFMKQAPPALDRAHLSLSGIKKDGLDKEVAGNAAKLVEAHGLLVVVERLRDLILLEDTETDFVSLAPYAWFQRVNETRTLLDSIIIDGIFGKLVQVAQKNPRLLVASARVIEGEEVEDQWWVTHKHRFEGNDSVVGARLSESRAYKKRALNAVVQSLKETFYEKQRQLGFLRKGGGSSGDVQQDGIFLSNVDASSILGWIEQRKSEKEIVRRFVVPCVPPSFSVLALYERELHRQYMRIITNALQLVDRDGSMLMSEQDLVKITSWYIKYKQEVDDQGEAIDSFLADSDRNRLLVALQKHCHARITAKITALLGLGELAMPKETSGSPDKLRDSAATIRQALRREDLADELFDYIGGQVKRILALNIQGLDQAIASTSGECLKKFQGEVLDVIKELPRGGQEQAYRYFICATANNMARCVEYSEDLRDIFIPLASDKDRSDIESGMESIIEGFRAAAAKALRVLINGINSKLESHASRLYTAQSGTEIILDMIATLEDLFGGYEVQLLPYHFEHLAIETLKRVVVWYLAPFLRLTSSRVEESVARRFASLPTFNGGLRLHGGTSDNLGDVRSREMRRNGNSGLGGLDGMRSSAVVAQIDKDISNIRKFIETKVVLYQKKQLQPTMEVLHAMRSLYTCAPTTAGLTKAFRDASGVVAWALKPGWVSSMGLGVGKRLKLKVAEVIWTSRPDVNRVVQLEAINVIRAQTEKEGDGERNCRFDEWKRGSKSGELGFVGDTGSSSSSLVWAASWRSAWRKRGRGREKM